MQILDIHVSLIEFETSFKQIFLLQLLLKNILDSCKPVTQIFQHLDSQGGKGRKTKGYGSRSVTEANDLEYLTSSPKSGTLLQMHVSSVYFALIKENNSGGAADI